MLYFTTLETFVDSSGPFRNYKRPQFPYVIGNTFHSKRIDFNYSTLSNQTDYDIQSDEWLRNTKSYNTNNTYSGYNYIFDSNKIKKQSLEVTQPLSELLKVLVSLLVVVTIRSMIHLYLTTVKQVVKVFRPRCTVLVVSKLTRLVVQPQQHLILSLLSILVSINLLVSPLFHIII